MRVHQRRIESTVWRDLEMDIMTADTPVLSDIFGELRQCQARQTSAFRRNTKTGKNSSLRIRVSLSSLLRLSHMTVKTRRERHALCHQGALHRSSIPVIRGPSPTETRRFRASYTTHSNREERHWNFTVLRRFIHLHPSHAVADIGFWAVSCFLLFVCNFHLSFTYKTEPSCDVLHVR
ncbi:hypothetical protein VTK73DRAFT_1524 [Phialemonium thermophilum]|uniref:Uncharacterized protein n=1 Tax=Phialemonium thermophilum TaxID=223376 RepID=A0ABR3X911_9PEZI